MATLSLRDVRKQFAGFEAIKGVSLEVRDHEFVVFVGPSGCGKSTLLRMIAGLEEITGGDLLIDGRRVNDLGPAERGLAMVFQSYALYPHMTVADNMAFSLKLAGRPRAERDAKVREAAAILQLEKLLARKPKELSGGQRQRVAIGRAIVRHPKAFLFDEPLSNLDAALRVQMRIELRRLHDSLDATMVYVTHDQVEAMTMADRIVVLNGGRIEQVGTPLELYHRPDNLFVAGFIGSPHMNLLRGELVGADAAGARVRLPGGVDVTVPAEGGAAARDVTFGVRPEDLSITQNGPINGRVAVAERLGSLTFLHVDIGDGAVPVVQTGGGETARVGETVRLAVNPAHCHVFGADGQALPRRGAHPLAGEGVAAQ